MATRHLRRGQPPKSGCPRQTPPVKRQTGLLTDQKTRARRVKAPSFYLTPAQLRKLDELAFQLNERAEQRINCNDIVRHLVERCSVEDLADLRGQEE